jgi:tripartite-type tricarboxylate transporter receptor subunit TctC
MLPITGPAHAYPDRPLTLVVPFPPIGSADIYGAPRITKLVKMMQTLSTPSLSDSLALELVQSLSGALDRPVNLDRHPRGRTIPGTRHATRAKPDGYTLLFADNPTITIFPALYPKLPFDPHKDLLPVAAFARMPIVLISASDNTATTVRHVTDRARMAPGQINYATVGDASTSHLTGELFRIASGAQIVPVTYNGSVPAINAVVTRHVEFGFVPLPAVLPYLDGGKVRVIAIAAASRHPAVPAVPTIAESGLPGFEANGWFGVFTPARTPGAIVSLLNYEINRALSEEALQRTLLARGFTPAPGSSEEFRELIQKDSERWGKLVRGLFRNPELAVAAGASR